MQARLHNYRSDFYVINYSRKLVLQFLRYIFFQAMLKLLPRNSEKKRQKIRYMLDSVGLETSLFLSPIIFAYVSLPNLNFSAPYKQHYKKITFMSK